jgi:hypothetical protein
VFVSTLEFYITLILKGVAIVVGVLPIRPLEIWNVV